MAALDSSKTSFKRRKVKEVRRGARGIFSPALATTRVTKKCHKSSSTIDGSEIPNNHLGCKKKLANNGMNYQPQVIFTGFSNHHQDTKV